MRIELVNYIGDVDLSVTTDNLLESAQVRLSGRLDWARGGIPRWRLYSGERKRGNKLLAKLVSELPAHGGRETAQCDAFDRAQRSPVLDLGCNVRGGV